jgi:hypothetical protein
VDEQLIIGWSDIRSGIRLRRFRVGVKIGGRAEANRSSNPQRGLILTDPSLWVEATTSVISSDPKRPAHEKYIR